MIPKQFLSWSEEMKERIPFVTCWSRHKRLQEQIIVKHNALNPLRSIAHRRGGANCDISLHCGIGISS
jgi:hypothetical protein